MQQDNINIDLKLPTKWEYLTEKQLRYLFGLLAQDFPATQIKTYCLFRWSGMQVMCRYGKGWWCKFDNSIAKIDSYKRRLDGIDGESVGDVAGELRGAEGIASKTYFNTLNLALPVEYRFRERSQHPALDPANAFLNYGYGILYGKVESALIRSGLDPYLGVLHRNDYNRPALAFDMIEPFRVWVDYVVFTLFIQKAVSNDCYSFSPNGACMLEPLGRRVIIQSLNDYLDEVIDSRYGNRSRATLIFLECQSLAQRIKGYGNSPK